MKGRLTLALLAVGLVFAAGVGWLVSRSLDGLAREEGLRHELVAGRVLDELERELTDWVDKEESRSFLEYRFFYVPERQVPGEAAYARSPLSEAPTEPFVLGWVQVEPDGRATDPRQPAAAEERLARKYGWTPDPVEKERFSEYARLVLAGENGTPQVVASAPANRAQASQRGGLLQSLNRALTSRDGRGSWSVTSEAPNVVAFESQASNPGIVRAEPDSPVDVGLSSFQGALAGERLVLRRSVRMGGETWQQAVVLDRPALCAHIEEAVLADSELRPWVHLAWGHGPKPTREYTFSHTFAPPFQDLGVWVGLDPIPGERAQGRATILVFASVLLGFGLVVGVTVHHMVAVRLEVAARRSDFVAAVSHELKTPLTSIRLMGEMLRDGMVTDEDRRNTYYSTLTAEAERLSRLIDNVLTLARLERGRGAPEPVVGSVGDVLAQVPEILGPHLQQAGFTLEVEVEPDLPPVVFHRDALLQVLLNLVDNAAKFSKEAEVRRIVLHAARAPEGVRLTVRDHGPGVPARQLGRIFEPFFRGERELTRRTRGTGIGLALVKGLVAEMGGRVRATNHPEGGLVVEVGLRGA